MADRINTCGCGLQYDPELSPGVCPDCGESRSISRAPGESQGAWNGRLGLPGGKQAGNSPARELPAEG